MDFGGFPQLQAFPGVRPDGFCRFVPTYNPRKTDFGQSELRAPGPRKGNTMINVPITLAAIGAAREIIGGLLLQARLARQNGDISEEQLADIELAGDESDAKRDALVDAARKRLSGN